MTKPVGREWKVRIDVDLPQEAHDRITTAIQRAALTEIAGLDVADGFSVSLRGPGRRGTPVREGEEDPFTHDLPGGGLGQTDGLVAKENETLRPVL